MDFGRGNPRGPVTPHGVIVDPSSMPLPLPDLDELDDQPAANCGSSLPDLALPITGPPAFPHRITCETLGRLLRLELDAAFDAIVVWDCRFACEYTTSHVYGARNLIRFAQLSQMYEHLRGRRCCIIFYSDTSRDRAPTWMHVLRTFDRMTPGQGFNNVAFPEIYLLDGGFRRFYGRFGGTELIEGDEQCGHGPALGTTQEAMAKCQNRYLKETAKIRDITAGRKMKCSEGSWSTGAEIGRVIETSPPLVGGLE
jgi:hypothetical protein